VRRSWLSLKKDKVKSGFKKHFKRRMAAIKERLALLGSKPMEQDHELAVVQTPRQGKRPQHSRFTTPVKYSKRPFMTDD